MRKSLLVLLAALATAVLPACQKAESPGAATAPAVAAKEHKVGVLLINHGSRQKAWRDQLLDVAVVAKVRAHSVDPGDHLKGRGEGNADALRLPAWRIVDVDAYIAAIERTLRANGYCAFVEKGDILKVKMVSRGNVFHEEIDVVENPPTGGAYVSFVVKDRCHDAGF